MNNPQDSSIGTAGLMATMTDFIPTSLLAAAEETLTLAASEVADQVATRPGRS
jgi:hypothetical protein